MAGDWYETTFEELVGGRQCVIGGPFGSNLTQAHYASNGVPIIRGSNMEKAGRYLGGEFAYVSKEKAKDLQNNQVQAGAIIVTQRGTLGQVSLAPPGISDRYIVSQSQMGVDVKSADSLFVFYLLKSHLFAQFLDGASIQTGVPHINLGLLRGWKIRVPPKKQQQQIGQTLGALDEKIELSRRMAETLQEMGQAFFKSWFIDFDPVRTKVEGRPSSMPEDLAALFPDSLGDDNLPFGWTQNPLIEKFNLTMGQSPPGPTYNEHGEGFPFYQGRTDFGFRYPARRIFCSQPSRLANEGDTLGGVDEVADP